MDGQWGGPLDDRKMGKLVMDKENPHHTKIEENTGFFYNTFPPVLNIPGELKKPVGEKKRSDYFKIRGGVEV